MTTNCPNENSCSFVKFVAKNEECSQRKAVYYEDGGEDAIMSSRAVWVSLCMAALYWVGASVVAGPPQQKSGNPSPAAAPPERATIQEYCVNCHNSQLKTAALAFNSLGLESVDQHPEAWEKAVRKLRTRQMPPAGLPRPDERTYDA